ncbi:MAG: Hint domain-containing protein [Paracoccaceae bacterium]
MPLETDTTTSLIDGRPATLESTVDTEMDDSMEYSVSVTTEGITMDVNIALVIDVSGSTRDSSGSDVDGDGDIDTVLEAQIIAAQTLFQSLIDAGYSGDEVEITLVTYSGSGSIEGTFTLDDQAAFDAALADLRSSGQTNFDDALDKVIDAWEGTLTDGDPNNDVEATDTNHVIFLSDGRATGGTDFTSELAIIEGTFNGSISAIGIGANSELDDLNLLDTTGGAVQITNVAELVDAIVAPPPPLSELTQIEIFVDGVSYGVLTPGDGTLVTTPLGYRVPDGVITGYPYVNGDVVDVSFVATFENGQTLGTTHSVTMTGIICFVTGTLIRTDAGFRPVEALAPGDIVWTRAGHLPVVWTGQTRVTAGMMRDDPALRPVRIRRNAFGPGRPFADLLVSPQHRLWVDDWRLEVLLGIEGGALAAAGTLVDGQRILRDTPERDITYHHVALATHEVLDSQGLLSESLDPAARDLRHLPVALRSELAQRLPAVTMPLGLPRLRRHEGAVWMAALA